MDIKFLLQLLKPKPRVCIGINCDALTVTLFELLANKNGFFCKNRFDFTCSLEQALAKNTIKSKHAILTIPDSLTQNKTIPVPNNLSEIELEDLMRYEIDKFSPYPIDEIYWDFLILDSKEQEMELIDVHLVLTKQEHVKPNIEVVLRAELIPHQLVLESQALWLRINDAGN